MAHLLSLINKLSVKYSKAHFKLLLPVCGQRGWQAITTTGRGDDPESGQGPMYLKIDH